MPVLSYNADVTEAALRDFAGLTFQHASPPNGGMCG